MTPTPGAGQPDLALRNAWRIARAHGHHWASSATPERVAAGRHILECAPWAARAPSCHEDVRELQPPPGEEPAVPPATYEDAVALSALATCTGSGRSVPAPTDDGVYSDGTGTGRLKWVCYPDGRVDLQVQRPVPDRPEGCWDGYPVLEAEATADRVLIRLLAPCRQDHLEALYVACDAVYPEAARDYEKLFARLEGLLGH